MKRPKPFKHKGRWSVWYAAKVSPTGKRQQVYFDSETAANKDIKQRLGEIIEHGRSGATAEERRWIQFARLQLGDLSKLPEVIRHWQRTGEEAITALTVADAVDRFTALKVKSVNKRTASDIRSRLGKFADQFAGRNLHEIHAGEVETFIDLANKDWSKKSFHKRLNPFFAYAKRQRWVAIDPMAALKSPEPKRVRKEVYTGDEFQELLMNAIAMQDVELLAFVAIAGFAMMRTSELVRLYSNEDVLHWEDFEWTRDRIHIRETVGKSTRRAVGNERFTPIIPALRDWLYNWRKPKGRVIESLHHDFSKRWRKLHGETLDKETGNTWYKLREPIPNGLRRSAISHKLAAEPELGIVQCARWAGTSEATIKGHYLELLSKEDGEAWFVTATDQLAEINAPYPVNRK
jgi:integrase